MEEISLVFSIIIGIALLVFNIILVVYIIKAGKYSEKSYFLIKDHLDKLNKKEIVQSKKDSSNKTFDKSFHDTWNEINKE